MEPCSWRQTAKISFGATIKQRYAFWWKLVAAFSVLVSPVKFIDIQRTK